MAFESFYGGRPGASLIIVKAYDSYEQLVEEFKKGGNSTDAVNYGEYAVINNISDTENHGNVYRRGLDFWSKNGGAVFVGNMAGPVGESVGIRIVGLVSSTSDLTGPPEVMFNNPEYKGWAVAVGQDGEIPDIYTYDYIRQKWFYIGNLPYAPITVTRKTVDYSEIN